MRWYDLHTQEKLGFRAIAAWQNTQETNPKRATQVMEQLIQHKAKCHGSIQSEDRIEKGVKTIYKAIHRVKYSRKDMEPIIEEYNCPHHGTGCPSSCTYYQKWLGRFDRFKPAELTPTAFLSFDEGRDYKSKSSKKKSADEQFK